MTTIVNLTETPDGTTIVLPPEVVEHLNARTGDKVHLVTVPGGVKLTCSAEFAGQLAAASTVMHQDHSVLKKLAE